MSAHTWFKDQLDEILGFSSEQVVNYVLSMEDVEEQRQYLVEMLDLKNPVHREFVAKFSEKTSKVSNAAPPGMVAYKKSENKFGEFSGGARPKNLPKGSEPANASTDVSARKPAKFVPLYSKDGQVDEAVVQVPGRNPCDCQAQKHRLVNNCIKCGRVVCTQEGSGPCLFCGNLVCSKDEQEVLDRGSKKSDQLRKKLMSNAEQHKNRLLEYDRTSEKRTQVIDDESDYFSVDSNKWLTNEQRKKLAEHEEKVRQQRHGSRLDRRICLDFAGRRVYEDEPCIYDPSMDERVKRILESKDTVHRGGAEDKISVNPNVSVARPTLVLSGERWKNSSKTDKNGEKKNPWRLQDCELQEMQDGGWCLTMHQPWASYLVSGIKKHEGRTWYSPHRGRLWIHSASKVPTDEEVAEVQDMYKQRPGGSRINFPQNLPTSCVLGCVDVTDVLGQEEYREKYPDGESFSSFVFVCENPRELLIKFPMSGQHKIYKMDQKIHQAVRKAATMLQA